MKRILKWLLWILLGAFLGALIAEGIGPHALISKVTGFLLIFIAAGLFFFSFKLRKKSETNSPVLPSLLRGLGVANLLASFVLFGTSISIEEIPEKYDEGMQALESGQWDKAVKSFSVIQSVNPKYRDTVRRLEEAKLNRAKGAYEKAKKLLSNAKANLSQKRYSASIDSTKEAISLLKDAKEFDESANLLSEAEKFLDIVRKSEAKSEEIQKKRRQQQAARRAKNAWKNQDNSTMAYIMIEDFVKNRLKSPSTAKFPGVFDGRQDHVTYLGNQKYRIISYVDSQNSFGAMIRTRFVAEIEQVSKDKWRLNSLEFLQ